MINTIKKIFLALCFAALLAACAVEDFDDEAIEQEAAVETTDSSIDEAQSADTTAANAVSTTKDIVVNTVGATFDADQLASFMAVVEDSRFDNEIPGVAVAIVEGAQIVLAEGVGVRDIRTAAPVTPQTLFHIGSTHKSITAMLIATLVDEGALGWDTPIVDIYPEFELSDSASTETVTVRHLLSMSSGIADYAEDDFDQENESAEDIFDLIAETDLLAPPGEQFSYSNVSASVAGYVGVLASGGQMGQLYVGYDRLLQERLFGPIGMTSATLSVEDVWASPNYAVSHVLEGGEIVAAESYDFTGDPLAPSGAIKASVLDMALYMNTQVSQGLAPNGKRVVSAENLTATWQPQIEDEESGGYYGLGWGLSTDAGLELVWHEGSYDNFTSVLMFSPDAEIGLVVLTNSDETGDFLEVVGDEFIEMLLDQ